MERTIDAHYVIMMAERATMEGAVAGSAWSIGTNGAGRKLRHWRASWNRFVAAAAGPCECFRCAAGVSAPEAGVPCP